MKLSPLALIAILALASGTARAEPEAEKTEKKTEGEKQAAQAAEQAETEKAAKAAAATKHGLPGASSDTSPKVHTAKGRPLPSREISDEDMSEDAAAMDKLRFMMAPGNYKCIGTVTPPGEHKSHPLTARVPVSTELDGSWQQVRYEENKTAEHPHPTKAIQFFTYDTVNKVFLRTSVDSLGRAINMTADNTDGERLTFTGHSSINGTTLPTRLIWEKLGKDVKLGWEWSPGEGNWFRSVDLTCRL